MGNDPHEGRFVDEVACIGGAYLVLPSDGPEDPFVVGCLLESSLLRMRRHTEFRAAVARMAITGLWLSDACLRRAGLHRQATPTATDEVHWPTDTEAESLQAAVRFKIDEISAAVGAVGIPTCDLAQLSFAPGENLEYTSWLANPMRTRPIMVCNEDVVIAAPSCLIIAIRDAIIRLARTHGVLAELAQCFRVAVESRVKDYLKAMHWKELGRLEISDGSNASETCFQFDQDKVGVLHCVSDDLESGLQDSDDEWWNTESCLSKVNDRIGVIEGFFKKEESPPKEFLHVVIVQGVGRPHTFGVEESGNPASLRMALSADELRVFCLLNLNDSLALWQVAAAQEALPVMSLFGRFLDHYELFRKRRKSFYYSDDGIPDMVMMMATGIQTRLDAQTRLDSHTVQLPGAVQHGRVVRAEGSKDQPIYLEWHAALGRTRPRLLVETTRASIWVEPESDQPDEDLAFRLVDTVAFWLAQATTALEKILGSASDRHLLIRVSATQPEEWTQPAPPADSLGLDSAVNEQTVSIRFGPAFATHCRLAENDGERELVRVLLSSLAELAQHRFGAGELSRYVDAVAPHGDKRRFLIMEGDLLEIISTDGLPRPRKVQSFDECTVADQLGKHLQEKGRRSGILTDDQRHSVCNQSVSHLYQQLQALFSKLRPDGLRELLVSRHETLIADRRHHEVIMASHLATFGTDDHTVAEYRSGLVETDKASLASRFLIEYVAATKVEGSDCLSDAAYDRLLAVASEVVHYGRMSDLLHYELSSHSIEMLGSGRLASADPKFDGAIQDTLEKMYRRFANNSSSYYREAVRRSTSTGPATRPNGIEELEAAAKAEFGLTFLEIGKLFGTIGCSPFTSLGGVGSARIQDLKNHVVDELGWGHSVIDAAIKLFSFDKRADFLKPAEPFAATDVFPWRFNRALSYLRRPLLREDEGETIVWGTRALRQAAEYLCGLCTNAKLKGAKSSKMKTYLGVVANKIGLTFNLAVAKHLEGIDGLVLRTQAKKFDGKRLQRPNGEDLGDVDVLAANPEKKRIWAIEAKGFSLAKTPAELANEREELFGQLDAQSGAVSRHLERASWLRSNVDHVQRELKLEVTPGWTVQPVLVIDSDLVTPKLVSPPFPVVLASDLPTWLSQDG